MIVEADLLREEWNPILVALVGSTVPSVAVTGILMHLSFVLNVAIMMKECPPFLRFPQFHDGSWIS